MAMACAFAAAGRALSDLDLGYESVEPWPLEVRGEMPSDPYVKKMLLGPGPGTTSFEHLFESCDTLRAWRATATVPGVRALGVIAT